MFSDVTIESGRGYPAGYLCQAGVRAGGSATKGIEIRRCIMSAKADPNPAPGTRSRVLNTDQGRIEREYGKKEHGAGRGN